MSDTTTCPSCSATLPGGAAFCTTCGTRLAAPEAPAADATRVDTPGLHDATQVYAPPPAPPTPPAPWQPADSTPPPPAATPAPPAAPAGWGAPTAAPATAPPPAWPPAEPTAAPPTTWGAPGAAPAAAPGAWNTPAPPAWGAPAPAAPAGGATGGSPIGGIVGVLGGVLVLVGLFTAWLGSNVGDDTITGWELAGGDSGFETADPYLLLALGLGGLALGALLFLGKARVPVRVLAIVAGVAVVITHVRDWMDIADIAKALPQGVEITAQFGFYTGIVGGVLLAIAAFFPAKS